MTDSKTVMTGYAILRTRKNFVVLDSYPYIFWPAHIYDFCPYMDIRVMTLSTRFWRWLLQDDRITRVVRVKTLVPCWDSECGAIAWPVLLVDRGAGRTRMTIQPIWDKARYAFWRRDAGI